MGPDTDRRRMQKAQFPAAPIGPAENTSDPGPDLTRPLLEGFDMFLILHHRALDASLNLISGLRVHDSQGCSMTLMGCSP